MSKIDIVRAWKDVDYRESLSLEEQKLLPDNPSGLVELSDSDLFSVGGAEGQEPQTSGVCASIVVGVSYAFSCAGNNCDDDPGGTGRGGTCGFATVGCC